MKKNNFFDESYDKEWIQKRIDVLKVQLDLPDQANVNALLEVLKCYMATNFVLKRFLQVFGKGKGMGLFIEQQDVINDIVKSYITNK